MGDWFASGGTRKMLLNRVATSTSESVISGSADWDVPLPLDPRPLLPPFPLAALPKFVSDYAEAIADATQTPVDLAAVLSLAVTAAVTSGMRVRIRPGFVVPLNLYLVVILAVGEGKTPVYQEFMRTLDPIEAELQLKADPVIREARARKTVAEANLAAIKKRLLAPKLTPQERAKLTPDLQDAQLALDEIHVPESPRIYTQDVTPEGLLKVVDQQDGRISVLDDEGGELFELLSRYSKSGHANQGIYLRGHDGGRYMSDWSTKDPIDLNEVMLTLGLTAQPHVLGALSADPALRGRGLLARILYSLPLSDVGYRDPNSQPVPNALREGFAAVLRSLANDSYESRGEQDSPIVLGPRAHRRFTDWWQVHEARLQPVGDLANIADWANKLPSEVARIAGNIHALTNPDDWRERPITSRRL